MEAKWNPQNKSQYLKGTGENVWSECPDEYLPQLKKEYDKKRFGPRLACTYKGEL
jgi:hypothetical protein